MLRSASFLALLFTVHCFLLARSAWAVCPDGAATTCYYVNDCCTRNDVYTYAADADMATGDDTLACASYESTATPARSIREIITSCPLAANTRIFVDTGFYLSRQYTVDCSVVDTANACELGGADPAGVAPFNDAGAAGNILIQVPNIAIIGVPFPGGTVVDGHGATGGGSAQTNVFYIDGPGGADSVRIQNIDIPHGQRGIFIDDADNNMIEGVLSRDHTGGPQTGIEEQLGSNNYFRNVVTANNGKRGLVLLGAATAVVENGTFYMDGSAGGDMNVLVGSQGGTDSSNVSIRNSIFFIETGNRRGLVVNDGSQAGFRSNFNNFIRDTASADCGRWRGTNATTLADWQACTDNNNCGDGATCTAATTECLDGGGGADSCDCESGSELLVATTHPVDSADRDFHMKGRFGHFDVGEPTWFNTADSDGDGIIDEGPFEIFTWGDEITYTVSPLDTGCNVATGACAARGIAPTGNSSNLEHEGNSDRPNAEGYAQNYGASRGSFTLPLTAAVVQGTLGDPDLIGGTPPTRTMGVGEPALIVTLTHTGGAANSDTFILGDMDPADVCTAPGTLAGPGSSYLQITDGVDTMVAYLSDMKIGVPTDWCIDPGEAATLYFQAYRPMPEGFYSGDYFATLVLRGWMYIKDHFSMAGINTLSFFRDFIQNKPRQMRGTIGGVNNFGAFVDGLVPFPDQAVTTTNKWTVRGGGVATADVARPIYVPGCFDATNAGANANNSAFTIRAVDGTADNIVLSVCENGTGAYSLSASVGGCDGASDSYVLIQDMNGGTYRTCSATAGVVTPCALATTCAAGSTAVTFNTGGDMGALCNGPATVELGLYDGAAVTVRTIPEPVYIVDSATANCRTSRIQYVQGTRDMIPGGAIQDTRAVGASFDPELSIRTVWNDRGTIQDDPANTFSGLTIMDAEAQSVTDASPRTVSSYCDPTGDSCDGGGANPLQVGESMYITFDDATNNGVDDAAPNIPAGMCNGTAELRLNVRGTEGADGVALNENPTVVDGVTISGGYDCMTCMAQTLEISGGDSSAGDNRVTTTAGTSTTLRAQLYNTGTAAFTIAAGTCQGPPCVGVGTACCTAGTCLTFTDGTAAGTFCAPASNARTCGADVFACAGADNCALGCAVGAGTQARVTFAATVVPAVILTTEPPSPYTPTIVMTGSLNETCDPDDIDVDPASTGIGDKVTESGWIEIER